MAQEDDKTTTRPDHDGSYRTLFLQPTLVQELLESFVPPELVEELCFDKMEMMPTTFITKALDQLPGQKELTRRSSDCIWKIPTIHKDKPLYFCLLMEFQSSQDPKMALRIATYITLLYELLLNSKPKEFAHGLPPVLPIVLYNGKDPWTAKLSLDQLISLKNGAKVRKYQLQAQYFLIDIVRLTKKQMPRSPNLVSTIFDMEKASHLNQHKAIIASIKTLFILTRDKPTKVALREAFTIFFDGVLFHRGSLADNIQLKNLTEVRNMYSTIDEMNRDNFNAGLEQGLMDTALEWLMKLGASKDKWRPQLEKMSLEELRKFTYRIARASSEQELES